ncbi:YbhB/YbcL family Raf kinase inhibitor-like protein [Limisphaera ngatamarikiensis]|jgi:Raf kinase inhibitor-like YbhB/YbcL family protein|uniref:YbhB/YbcL family Raf kinase inhibitor-like protein n=1 Tax=Limisphaera ngatamarikiensis TaxID=1324935 RepID=A0A6M1RQ74_9BACT|nr:YbhB/YbcL family Raf kinase inhibitor-like protein [Limisphaera ngatamarikiensis]NGO39557.1 YbhB/YbcL family Raf kinase inhibitor-like protein [Limisphaera ngatamarikiensis]
MKLEIRSPAFGYGAVIPQQYTGLGRDISPPLEWSGVPGEARSLALVVEDPDAPMGTWTHWLVYALSPQTRGLAEDQPRTQYLAGGARQGINDFRRLGYGGPLPPPGPPHRYFFRLYALDCELDLPPGLNRARLLEAMKGHIVAQAEWMGTFQRK